MKFKDFFKIFFIAFLACVALTACGGDDDEPDDPNKGNGTEQTGNYIATTQVKTAEVGNEIGKNGNIRTIYEDYNIKYELRIGNGQLLLLGYTRINGSWEKLYYYYQNAYGEVFKYFDYSGYAIMSVGKVNGLSDITKKTIIPESYVSNQYLFPGIQPYYGYAAMFGTETGGIKYLRIYIKDYKLYESGTLKNITVQYQLY